MAFVSVGFKKQQQKTKRTKQDKNNDRKLPKVLKQVE